MKFEVFWKNPGYKIRPKLAHDIECDYLIVGGGITGVSAAYFLTKAGQKNVVLIEKHHVASGATGMAAGTLVLQGEKDLEDVMHDHGKQKAKMYWNEVYAGMKSLQQLIKDEQIDCEAEIQDTMYCGYKHKTAGNVEREFELQKIFTSDTVLLGRIDLKKEIHTDLFDRAILSKNHGLSVNPLKLTQNLSTVVGSRGVRIYENTACLEVKDHIAETPGGNIHFKKLIWAVDDEYPTAKVRTVKTTIIMTRPLIDSELHAIGFDLGKKKKIVFDTKKNYHYFKITHDNRLLVGYGNLGVHRRYKKTDPHRPHLKQIEIFLKKLFPDLGITAEYAWAGTFGTTADYDPLIRLERDTAVIAGAASQVVCFLAARYVVDRLLGKDSPLEDFFEKR